MITELQKAFRDIGKFFLIQGYFEIKRLLVHAEIKALMELDQKQLQARDKMQMELLTNLEPCMMHLLMAKPIITRSVLTYKVLMIQ